jgi:NDP-sugar pyrophosphorylase family protein
LDNCGTGISDIGFPGFAVNNYETMSESTDQTSRTLEDIPFLILAGGKGTRIADFIKDVPKSMIEIAGEPFVAHVLRLLKREGVHKVVFLVQHLCEPIESFVGDGSRFDLEVSYSRDGEDALGTGAAVSKALSRVESDFAVMYGDTYLDISMAPAFNAFKDSQFKAMMTVLENHNQWQPSNVEFEQSSAAILKYDKQKPTSSMHFLDYGLSFFGKETFEKHAKGLKKNSFDLGDIFKSMAKKKELGGYAVNRRFYDIGTLENLVETRAYLSQNSLWQLDFGGKPEQ